MRVEYVKLNTCVVGTGAAGFNAAIRLKQFGCEEVAIVTEGVYMGTSRNTGSDKQTYYKLGLGGDAADSVDNMAKNLFAGGCMDGDTALIEAALSARCFLHLCELGVPFPTNRFGEYVGYKTDHDPYARATSAGPLTSKFMTEALEKKAKEINLPIYDHHTVVQILAKDGEVCGLVAVCTVEKEPYLTIFHCKNIVYATGGPAGIYANSVYPHCHHGATGVAFEAGASGQNLTEWQYGLASTSPRWNVSGTYMQVLPRFVSVDEQGEEHEFLSEYFKTQSECLSMIFLKGYQWPFDCRKVMNGSSVIDLLVYREEMMRGRKVYLDFTKNPYGCTELDYSVLSDEAREYLEKAGATFGRPIDRLEHMNAPAVALYKDKGVDLHKEKLPISLCAQHNNGGIAVDLWWQSCISGLFACGEAAGTHGITRPGGSALNAGQVGSLRAAQYIAAKRQGEGIEKTAFDVIVAAALEKHRQIFQNAKAGKIDAALLLQKAMERMSRAGAAMRTEEELEQAYLEAKRDLDAASDAGGDILLVYRLRDVLITQIVYLGAMADFCKKKIGSRGSCTVYQKDGQLRDGLEERFRFSLADVSSSEIVQTCRYEAGECKVEYRPVRPIPDNADFFENVWKEYRKNGNIY